MAHQSHEGNIPGLVASTDLSGDRYKLVVLDSSGEVALAGAGAACVGVLTDEPSAQGQAASVRALDGSTMKVQAGAAVTAGDLVASDASALAVTAGAGDYAVGIAKQSAAGAGELISVVLGYVGQQN